MRLELQLSTPQSSQPIIAPIQDTVTSSFQMTQNDILMSEAKFLKYAGKSIYIPVYRIGATLPALIIKSREDDEKQTTFYPYRTGKQLFSQTLPAGTQFVPTKSQPQLYFHAAPVNDQEIVQVENGKEFNNYIESLFEDKNIVILDSELLKGVVTSSLIARSPTGLNHWIIHEFGNACALRFQSEITRVNNDWFADYGFSVSARDCVLPNGEAIETLKRNGLKTIREHPLLKIGQKSRVVASISLDDDEEDNELAAAADEDENKDNNNKRQENPNDTTALLLLYDETTTITNTDTKHHSSELANVQQRREFMRNGSKARVEQLEALERQRERTIINILNQFTSFVGAQAQKQVKHWNRIWQMIESGGKGKEFNLTQILALVGQTEINNQRIKYDSRITAHFPKADTHIPDRWIQECLQDPLMAQGFVSNGFAGKGMTAYEFYVHAMGGRLGMVSSAILTGDTGYAHRRLVSAMANLSIFFDLSVRDSAGNLLQILYGNDGFDATHLCKFDLPLLTMDNQQVQNTFCCTHDQTEKLLWGSEQTRSKNNSTKIPTWSKAQLKQFLQDEIVGLTNYRNKIREARLHYDCIKFDSGIVVPANPFLLLHSAKRRFAQGKIQSKPNDPILSPSLVIALVHGTIEHMYRFYRGFYNRLWDFEASILSALSIKNVLVNYRFNFAQLQWILCELIIRFSRALVDARELTGPLAAQMVGQLFTQASLNAFAGSSEGSEEGTINIIQELINFAQKPKNPSMRVYPVPLSEFLQFMTPEMVEKFVFRGKYTVDEVMHMSRHVQTRILSEFIRDQLVYRVVSDFTINTPRVVQEPDLLSTEVVEDRSWLIPRISLMTATEQENLRHNRSDYVIRFTLDAQKCVAAHLSPYDIVRAIRIQLDDDLIPNNASQLQKKVNAATEDLSEEEVKDALNYSTIYDNSLVALVSPTITHSETQQEYWVLRLYVSPDSKYYKNFAEKEHIGENVKKLMNMLMLKMYLKAHVCGVEGVRTAKVEEEVRKLHDSTTGKIVSETECLVITRGTAMAETLALPFVDNSRSMTSFLIEVDEVWGVEVGAKCLGRNLQKVLQARNGNIDLRHLQSVVKTMCHRGFFMPFRRHGINRIHDTGCLQKCIAAGTGVMVQSGLSKPIEELIEPGVQVMSWRPNDSGIVCDTLKHGSDDFNNKGMQECYQITLLDGRTLICTGDHKVQTRHRGWVETKYLVATSEKSDELLLGPDSVIDSSKYDSPLDKNWVLPTSSTVAAFSWKTEFERDRSMALARILGYIYKCASMVACFHTMEDLNDFQNDVKKCFGVKCVSWYVDEKTQHGVWAASLPPIICNFLFSQSRNFIYESNTPAAFVREFLAALIAHEDVTKYNRDYINSPTIELSLQYGCLMTREELERISELIAAKLGFKCEKISYSADCVQLTISSSLKKIEEFSRLIGFRYASDKQYQISIAAAWSRVKKNDVKLNDFLSNIGYSATTRENFRAGTPVYYLPIVKVEKLEQMLPVYDLSIQKNHSFVANNIVVSNCSYEETLEMLADAAASGELEDFKDPTSNSMIGKPVPIGTGATETLLPDTIGPDTEVMKSHMEFQRHRVLPVYNALDRRVMLYNSGEQQIYHANDSTEAKEFGQIGGFKNQEAEEVERLMHAEQRYTIRYSTLLCQKHLVSTDQQIYADEKNPETEIVVAEPSSSSISAAAADTDVEQKTSTKFKNLSAYWQQVHLQRERARQQMKEKIALKQVLSDHTQAINVKKRKVIKANKKTTTMVDDEQEETKPTKSQPSSSTYCMSFHGSGKRKLPTEFQIMEKEVANSLHLKGEEFTSQIFVTNKKRKILPKMF